MMPGRINPRQMNQMMKRLGINVKEIENVKKVVIQTDKKEYIFDDAEVTIMDAQGQKTFQISGRPKILDLKDEINKEDIDLIIEQTGGDIAEAIIKLTK